MRILRGSNKLSKLIHPTIATIGNFDGFHLGHQEVIRFVIDQSKHEGLESVLISFEPTPKEFFTGVDAPARIYPIRTKFELAHQFGFDYFTCLRFNQLLASMPAVDFVEKILHDSLQIKALVVGDDFQFGYQRDGDINLLREMGASLGFEVKDQSTILYKHTRISSSLIREKLANGLFDDATTLLGRPFSISGRVFHGDKKGRTIGFPTANILLHRQISPIQGVFTVTACNKSNTWQGVANVGKRPTVNGQRLQLEVHLFDCDETLYGQRLDVEFHTKIRQEIKFASFEDLKQQITLDVAQAQQYFSERT